MQWVVAVVLFLLASLTHAACYVSVGVGQSSIHLLGAAEIEGDLFETEYSSSRSVEDREGTTGSFGLGCFVTENWKVEIGMFDGLKHTVESEVTVQYDDVLLTDFPVERTLRARGYALSGIWEHELLDRRYIFGRLGVAYVMVEGDVSAFNSPYSIHAERNYVVPVVGVGGRYAIDDQWSMSIEYGLVGHYNVRHLGLSLQYAF